MARQPLDGLQNGHTEKPIHVLIIGAGLTGLLFAQGLRNINAGLQAQGHPPKYTYMIYERDPSQFFRGGGFSLTIHWALPFVEELLLPELRGRILECVGNQPAMEAGEMGYFTYLNLRKGEPILRRPVPADWKGARMVRTKFISLLMEGLHVEYSSQLCDISFPTDDTVCAIFKDGRQAIGDLLIGADGSNSAVRRFLYGAENAKTRELPVRMILTRAEYPLEKLESCLAIDPHTFHGGDPIQNGYLFFAFLDVPPEGSAPDTIGAVQMTFTWPYERGYLGEAEPSEPPKDHGERLEWLKRIGEHWTHPVGDLVRNMPKDSITKPIILHEWLASDFKPIPTNGRIALVGDAAHVMTSFRGENANHGSVDVANIISLLKAMDPDVPSIKQVVKAYEAEMLSRTTPATHKARQACFDANHFADVKAGSPFLAPRVMLEHD